MNADLKFGGRVAVVTGAGRGIGRSYALLLASRGASVVVNDLGGGMEGAGSDSGPSHDVVREIIAAGGSAVANTSDVSTTDGGQAIIDAAIAEFGRIDIVVNNAGIMRWAAMPECDADHVRQHLDVHVLGSFNTVRAAWPHMVAQGYGRIVMTTSTGTFGLKANLSYATAKSGLVGMTRSLAINGAKTGIKINLIAPVAATRMGGLGAADDEPPYNMRPELVAPMVAFLAHESCPVSGEMYAAGAGRFTRIFIAETPGYIHADLEPTVEDVVRNWATINDESDYFVPANLIDWSNHFLARP